MRARWELRITLCVRLASSSVAGTAPSSLALQAQIWRLPKVGRFSLHESRKFVCSLMPHPKQGTSSTLGAVQM